MFGLSEEKPALDQGAGQRRSGRTGRRQGRRDARACEQRRQGEQPRKAEQSEDEPPQTPGMAPADAIAHLPHDEVARRMRRLELLD